MKKTKLSLLTLGLLVSVFSLSIRVAVAAPAVPGLIDFKQPDGTVIKINLYGDEYLSMAETVDGYALMFNDKGEYEYAKLNEYSDLVPSGIAARNESERSMKAKTFLSKIQKGLSYSQEQMNVLRSIRVKREQEFATNAFPTTGSRKLVCILMGFKDKSFTKSKSAFQSLFNQVNYTAGGATGSVKDYYKENSHGQLDLSVTVAGPYTAANNMSYYGAQSGNSKDANPRALVTEAVKLADKDVNYADFDNDGDDYVDGVYVIYAGYGQEAGASSNAIWAHAWSIRTVTLDGKKIRRYSCSAELRGNSGSNITRIGVICHEFGHVLGAPDYYDTDGNTGGKYSGTGRWDMMASGSWNNGGATPAHHNVYTKTKIYNWAAATELKTAQTITIEDVVKNNTGFYQINTKTSGEYFLIENRQKTGFDANIPGHGMVIYRVHKGVDDVGNKINATHPQRMYPVCANSSYAMPTSSSSSYGTINGGGCPFPGTGKKTSFTDETKPSAKSWAGANTGKPITKIVEKDGKITFDFMGGGSTEPDNEAPTVPTGLSKSSVAQTSLVLSWNASTDNIGVTGYDIYQDGSFVKSSAKTNAQITGLTANTTYSFTVKAKDAAGNKSAASNSLKVTTKDQNADDGGPLAEGVTSKGKMDNADDSDMWYIDVPSGTSNMRIVLDCPGSDFDTYGRFNTQPTTRSYDWRGYTSGGEENTVRNPQSGRHYIMVKHYSGSGEYSLRVTFNDNSGVISQTDNRETSETKEIVSEEAFSVYPNPNNGEFQVEMGNIEDVNGVFIVDISGKQVYSNTNLTEGTLQIQDLKKGIYTLYVIGGTGTVQKRLIVK